LENSEKRNMKNPPIIAVTLGSNGFHLFEVGEDQGKLETKNHLYENVQAESYLDGEAMFSDDGIAAIMGALRKFGNHVMLNPGCATAAIATGSFRRGKNADVVIEAASQELGIPIRVLSGQDESLLCYLGIASRAGFAEHNRLVMDVGGGSTELMIARENVLERFFSLDIGCVSLTRMAFGVGEIKKSHFEDAMEIARECFKPISRQLTESGWDEVMGCGGTVSSLYSVLQVQRMAGRFITGAGLSRFENAVVEKGSALPLCEAIVQSDRSRVLPAGVCILSALFDVLGIEKLTPVFSSVGQGLVVQIIQQQKRMAK
jgi:exopolyphosphatase/guanosine-5'-triphosphate,3'-diphosphate pyrophosphatase